MPMISAARPVDAGRIANVRLQTGRAAEAGSVPARPHPSLLVERRAPVAAAMGGIPANSGR
jgi:hypothetical protein